ncbi:hypothetical protein J7J35_04440, partial [Candidatus Bipolaricaulota bacterium]|nr:hypothetical protein [Candidatus Bipolaricaulota bacterium]
MYKQSLLLGVLLAISAGMVLSVKAQWIPSGLVSVKGTVAQFKPAPEGKVDALFLTDGTEVHFPPSDYARIAAAIGPGTEIIVT